MLSERDTERVIVAAQAANLLTQDLRELVAADDPLLSDLALDILAQVISVEQRLVRIAAIVQPQ